ncbi:MAG: hypothetical protein AB7I18_09175 [Candidatus Berkiella sp.]
MPKLKRTKQPQKPPHLLHNLRRIKKNLKKYQRKVLPTILYSDEESVKSKQISNNDLKELEHEIDILIQKAASTLAVPLPSELGTLAEEMAQSDPTTLVFRATKLKTLLKIYYRQVDQYYLDKNVWHSPDGAYQSLLNHPQKFSRKAGGAKNAGKRTGVYSFQENDWTETMLIKQGADVGETIAEYIGANLYKLTIPDYSARCIMVRDDSSDKPGIQDVYVASIYPKGKLIQDTYAAAGYRDRGLFAGEKARLKALFNSDESMIRKILDLNEDTGHTLEYSAANVLWHGDHDFHAANTVFVQSDEGSKFVKIDHGFSFFNFKKKLVDIFNPFAGKVLSISPKQYIKGGKAIQFFPTNHFWDYAIENKQFYFNPQFVKACEEIANRTPEEIRLNIEQSLNNVQEVYGQHAQAALIQLALRIGMKQQEIAAHAKNPNVDFLRYRIEDYMVTRLIERQAAISKLAAYCKNHTGKLDKNRHAFSKKLNKKIIECLDQSKKMAKQNAKGKIAHQAAARQQSVLSKEIELLKLVQQANDLGLLTVSENGEFTISDEFYFHNSGQRQLISPQEFKDAMSHIVSQKSTPADKIDIQTQFPLSEQSLAILRDIRIRHQSANQPQRKAY